MGMEIQRHIAPILQRVTNTNISKRDSSKTIKRAENLLKAIEEPSKKKSAKVRPRGAQTDALAKLLRRS
jgi:hypothetical protein